MKKNPMKSDNNDEEEEPMIDTMTSKTGFDPMKSDETKKTQIRIATKKTTKNRSNEEDDRSTTMLALETVIVFELRSTLFEAMPNGLFVALSL